MSAEVDILQPYRQLLEAGFPSWQIADQVRKHIAGLESLPPGSDSEAVCQALREANEFLALLEADHDGKQPD